MAAAALAAATASAPTDCPAGLFFLPLPMFPLLLRRALCPLPPLGDLPPLGPLLPLLLLLLPLLLLLLGLVLLLFLFLPNPILSLLFIRGLARCPLPPLSARFLFVGVLLLLLAPPPPLLLLPVVLCCWVSFLFLRTDFIFFLPRGDFRSVCLRSVCFCSGCCCCCCCCCCCSVALFLPVPPVRLLLLMGLLLLLLPFPLLDEKVELAVFCFSGFFFCNKARTGDSACLLDLDGDLDNFLERGDIEFCCCCC